MRKCGVSVVVMLLLLLVLPLKTHGAVVAIVAQVTDDVPEVEAAMPRRKGWPLTTLQAESRP